MPGAMLGILKSKEWTWARVQKMDAWSLDRNWHRTEAERHLKARNYADAEVHFIAAVEEADRFVLSAAKRVRLRLRLAEVQRRRAFPAADLKGRQELNQDKLREAEATV